VKLGRALGSAIGVALALASFAPALPQTQPDTATTAGSGVQTVPAVIDFKDRANYKGGVYLDYGKHPALPTQDGVVSLEDGKRHPKGYVALADGAGTFTSQTGAQYVNTYFSRGRAEGWGKVTIPAGASSGVRIFAGLFRDGAPVYGKVTYADGSSYAGYFDGGCYAGPPSGPDPVSAAGPPPAGFLDGGLAPVLPPTPAGTYTDAKGETVVGVWQHSGDTCGADRIAQARVTYADGDVYVGDLDARGYVGFGAYYSARDAQHANDSLLCGTFSDDGPYDGRYRVLIGRFAPPAAAADCYARPSPDWTLMRIAVPKPSARLDGMADIFFPNGDHAEAPIVAGALTGRGSYTSSELRWTLAGTFRNGSFGRNDTLVDSCGRKYRVGVSNGVVTNAPGSSPAYLFVNCDRFVAGRGGFVDRRGFPQGPGTRYFTDGESVAGEWHDGRLTGDVVAHVLHPEAATIVVRHARQEEDRLLGDATVRFQNGDEAHAAALRIAESSDRYQLDGAGDFRSAETGCVTHGTYRDGRLRGRATLDCGAGEPVFTGTIGPDGTVQ
jgi:hypothetical protein